MVRALLTALTLTVLTGLASAQVSENACRSAESDNFARCNGDGTATGRLTDVIIIRNNEGRVIVQATVDWFRRNLPYYVYNVANHSGDQFSVRFSYWCLKLYHPKLCGGTVEVWRGYQRRDIDPIY